MSLIDNMRSKLTAIADAVRTKNGATDTYTLDGIASAILALEIGSSSGGDSGGGSSGGSSGGSAGTSIENGYTVNFYDSDSNLIESHSTKAGFWIDKPISYTTDSWLSSDGTINNFPLTGEAGATYNLYSNKAKIAETLYNKYGVDKTTYPYIFIYYRTYNNTAGIVFTKSNTEVVNSDTNYLSIKYDSSYLMEITTTDVNENSPLLDILNVITNNISSSNKITNAYTLQSNSMSKFYFYTNSNLKPDNYMGMFD